jgi:hypothetical protein
LFHFAKNIAMSEKELKQLKKDILKDQKRVGASKAEAVKYLVELGILNKNGQVKKRFKSIQ